MEGILGDVLNTFLKPVEQGTHEQKNMNMSMVDRMYHMNKHDQTNCTIYNQTIRIISSRGYLLPGDQRDPWTSPCPLPAGR